MADNVAITAGSGTTVATDDVGGVHYQKVKLSIGADDTANPLAVGAGAVDTGTPRMTLASDDPAVAHLGTLANTGVKLIAGTAMAGKFQIADSGGVVVDPVAPGAAAVAASSPVTLATDEPAVFLDYEAVTASATDAALGATGATGDWLSHIIITPGTAAAGAVSIKDGAGSAISIFAGGGTTALPTLAPITVPLGATSTGGAWSVTTGANVTVLAFGRFT